VIKVITGVGQPLAGRLFLFDAADFTTRTLKISKDDHVAAPTELIDYEQFCGIPQQTGEDHQNTDTNSVAEIDVHELEDLIKTHVDFDLIDVREPYEYEIVNLQGKLIPKGDVNAHLDEISRDKKVVIHCRSGKRSADVIRDLQSKYGYDNLINLKGGILAWAKEIDQSLPVY
jgi:adenylyltransferase/sulfurtransferase